MTELYFLSIAEAVRGIRRGELNPVDLAEAHLSRIAALGDKLRCYITVDPDLARTQARQAASRRSAGTLCGIPVSYKDLIATAGMRTTGASRVHADWIPESDAWAVKRMRANGAVTLGKATLNEFAFSATSEDDFIKPARNPWNLSASPGLSSSGSGAGVAAGLAMASIATDSGGSIRIPASFCGVTGLKPTYGLVGRTGVLPLSYSCDHVGLMTRSAEDAAIVLTALAGADPQDPACQQRSPIDYSEGIAAPIRGQRIGALTAYAESVGLDPEVQAGFEAALAVFRSSRAIVRNIDIPHLNYAPAADFTILRCEGYNTHFKNLRDHREKYGPSAFRQIAAGGCLSAADYYRAQQARTLIAGEVAQAFETVDILAMPTTPQAGMPGAYLQPSRDVKVAHSSVAFLAPFNLTGSPAISIPCGFTKAGMPVGLQLVGRNFDEASILRAAHAYQTMTDWHRRRPSL
jgi:aspartyl-tRNA(Asn)/glutamyl-tRNA(Gln) amidotransferase subunit A